MNTEDNVKKSDLISMRECIKNFFIEQLGFEFDDEYYITNISLFTRLIEEEKKNPSITQKEREKRTKEYKRAVKYYRKKYEKAKKTIKEVQVMVNELTTKCVSGNAVRDAGGCLNGTFYDNLIVVFGMLEDEKLLDIFLAEELATRKEICTLLKKIVDKVHLDGKKVQYEKSISYGTQNCHIGSLKETLKSGVSLYTLLIEATRRKNKDVVQKAQISTSLPLTRDKNVIREFAYTLSPEMYQLKKLSELHKMDGYNTIFSTGFRAYKVYGKHAVKVKYAQTGLEMLKGSYGFSKTVERLKQLLAKETELARKSLQQATSVLSPSTIESAYNDYLRFEKVLDVLFKLNDKKNDLLAKGSNPQHENYLNQQISNIELEKEALIQKHPEFAKMMEPTIEIKSEIAEVKPEVFSQELDEKCKEIRTKLLLAYREQVIKRTEDGTLNFSQYLEKYAPQETELIEYEKSRESQNETIYKQYLRYLAARKDKLSSKTFKEFVWEKYALKNVEIPTTFKM